jgi:hypothetical protein
VRAARHVAVAERDSAASNELLGFVATAGDHDDVAVGGSFDCGEDGALAVQLDVDPGVLADAGSNGESDLGWVFVARVVAGKHYSVCCCGFSAHQRPLGSVAVAAGAEDDGELASTQRARGSERASASGVCAKSTTT